MSRVGEGGRASERLQRNLTSSGAVVNLPGIVSNYSWPSRAEEALKFVAVELTFAGAEGSNFRGRRLGPVMAGSVNSLPYQ